MVSPVMSVGIKSENNNSFRLEKALELREDLNGEQNYGEV
jgi:hypothetical protein